MYRHKLIITGCEERLGRMNVSQGKQPDARYRDQIPNAGLSALSPERLGGMALDWVTYGPIGAVAKALKQRDEYILSKM